MGLRIQSLCLAAVIIMTGSPPVLAQMSVVDASLRVGDDVKVDCELTGGVTIESDIVQQSMQATAVNGVVSVGALKGPGFYEIRILQGNTALAGLIVALPAAGSTNLNLAVVSQQPVADTPRAIQQRVGAVKKFVQQLDKTRLKTALKDTLQPWLANNVVNIGAGTTELLLCIGAEVPPACVAAKATLASLALDMFTAMLDREAKAQLADKKLSDAEYKLVHSTLTVAGNTAQLTVQGLDEVLVNVVIEEAIENADAKLTVKLSVDEAKKVRALIHIVKN